MTTNPRPEVVQAVRDHGAAPTARVLGCSRNAVLSYVSGTARQTTRFFIEAHVDRLSQARDGGR